MRELAGKAAQTLARRCARAVTSGVGRTGLLGGALALAALAWGATAEPTGSAGTPAVGTAPSSLPLREIALDRLPPGVRPASERAGVAIEAATYGDRWVERVARPGGRASDWLEVEFTVDPDLETRIRRMLEERNAPLAHVILLDPRSGELFTYVSTDPERFPATRPYPTASLMKVITAAALLREDPDAASRSCRWFGSPYDLIPQQLGGGGHADAPRPVSFWGEPWVASFRTALAMSNNQCFAGYAVHDLGAARLLREVEAAGLVEAPAKLHPAGAVAPVEETLDLGNLGSGLAGSRVTPLGAARLAALLADGRPVTPTWIAEVRDAQGMALDLERPPLAAPVWDRKLADELRGLMRGVVEDGTARRAFHDEQGRPRLAPVAVSGKTGTLRGDAPPGLYQWFIGVAPAAAPRIAVAALVVHEGPVRGASASEIAADSLEQVFCTAPGRCDPERVERLFARAAGREAQVVRSLRETVEEVRRAEAGLDAPVRPLGDVQLDLPRRLLRRKVQGEIVLRVSLDTEGLPLGVEVESTDLPPEFSAFLVEEVGGWRFTPPRRFGRPVTATARLPIPIQVN